MSISTTPLLASNATDTVATDSNNQEAVSYLYGFNNTSWDRIKTAAVYAGGTTSTTGLLAAQAIVFDGTSYQTMRTASSVGDANNGTLISPQGQYGWNGSGWDKQRVNNVHKYQEYLSLAAGTTYTWWTPAAGKKFRLMSVMMGSSAATMLTLKDGANNILTFNISGRDTKDFQLGNNGYLSSAANKVLNVYNNSATTITFWLTVLGTEE